MKYSVFFIEPKVFVHLAKLTHKKSINSKDDYDLLFYLQYSEKNKKYKCVRDFGEWFCFILLLVEGHSDQGFHYARPKYPQGFNYVLI